MQRNQLMSIEAQAAVVALSATQLSAETFRLAVKELVALGADPSALASAVSTSSLANGHPGADSGSTMVSAPSGAPRTRGQAPDPADPSSPSSPGAPNARLWVGRAAGAPGAAGSQAPGPRSPPSSTPARSNRKPMELIKFEKTTLCVPKDLFRLASAKFGGDVATRERARTYAREAPSGTTNRSSWVQEQLRRALSEAARSV